MKVLKMAVIGLGKMGLHMIDQVENTPMDTPVEITAVCDANEQGLQDFAASHPSVKTYLTYQEPLNERRLTSFTLPCRPSIIIRS